MSDISTSFDARVDVKNKHNQIALVLEETNSKNADDPNKETKESARDHVGGTKAVGNGEFRDLVGGVMNYKWVDKDGDGEVSDGDIYVNDAEVILEELLLGDGIDGVELVGLDGDSFTIATYGAGGTVDYMVFEGRAAELALQRVDEADAGGFDINRDGKSAFAILDMSDPDAFLKVGASGRLATGADTPDVGNKLRADDLPDLLAGVLLEGGYSGVELIDVDASSISLSLTQFNGAKDTLLITNIEGLLEDNVMGELNAFISNFGQNGTPADNFSIDGSTNTPDNGRSPDGDLFEKIEDEFGFNFGNIINNGNNPNSRDDNNLLDALVAAGGTIGGSEGAGGITDEDEQISLVGVDSDSFTFMYEANGQTDIFVFDYA